MSTTKNKPDKYPQKERIKYSIHFIYTHIHISTYMYTNTHIQKIRQKCWIFKI